MFLFLVGINSATAQPDEKELEPTSAIVKGKLFAYNNQDNGKIPISLAVRNLRTQEREWRVFSPDTLSGDFFIFLPADERYEINVYAKGFKPYTIVLFVPKYTYMYEINRSIYFEPIYLMDRYVGQQAILKEDSQHLYMTYDSADFVLYPKAKYNTLKELIASVMRKGNTDALDSLTKINVNEAAAAMPKEFVLSASTSSNSHNNVYKQLFSKLQQSYREGNWEYIDKEYVKHNVGRNYFQIRESEEQQAINKAHKVVVTHTVLFENPLKSKLDAREKKRLDKLAHFINKDPRLALEILGKTQSNLVEDEQSRLKLSQKRTKKVYRYLKKRIDDPSKFHYIVYGLSKQLDEDATKKNTSNGSESKPRVELLICMDK